MDPFERIPIGDTGVTVTRLGLGSAPLGGNKAADGLYGGAVFDESLRIVNRAYEAGVRYFDTAPLYGWGKSEVRVGMGLAGRDRDSLTISTKAGRLLKPVSDGPRGPENLPELDAVFDYTRDGIRRSLDESLVRLKTDRVEILMLHDADQGGLEKEGFETALPALVELREEGVVKAIGCGMNEWEMTLRFVRAFDLDFILLAGRYTLLEQGALDEFMPLCVERGVKIAVGGPYNSGVLARDLDRPVSYDYEIAPQSVIDRAKALGAVCQRNGVDLKAAAIQFVVAHPAVATVIPGATTLDELEQNLEMAQAPIPPALWDDLRSENLIHPDAPTP